MKQRNFIPPSLFPIPDRLMFSFGRSIITSAVTSRLHQLPLSKSLYHWFFSPAVSRRHSFLWNHREIVNCPPPHAMATHRRGSVISRPFCLNTKRGQFFSELELYFLTSMVSTAVRTGFFPSYKCLKSYLSYKQFVRSLNWSRWFRMVWCHSLDPCVISFSCETCVSAGRGRGREGSGLTEGSTSLKFFSVC